MPYVAPKGGTRAPSPKPTPKVGRVPRFSWRQPTGGVRDTAPRA